MLLWCICNPKVPGTFLVWETKAKVYTNARVCLNKKSYSGIQKWRWWVNLNPQLNLALQTQPNMTNQKEVLKCGWLKYVGRTSYTKEAFTGGYDYTNQVRTKLVDWPSSCDLFFSVGFLLAWLTLSSLAYYHWICASYSRSSDGPLLWSKNRIPQYK